MKKRTYSRYTFFNNFFTRNFLYIIASIYLKILGWKLENNIMSKFKKSVIIGAPHTSNWDFVFALLFLFKIRVKNIYFIGKDTLVKPPFGIFLKWFGVIPVDRSKSQNVVAQVVDIMKKAQNIHLVIAPSGTRKKVKKWKTGFYYIAKETNLPILLGFIDYKRKKIGFIDNFRPKGSPEQDIKIIQDYYKNIMGKKPDNQIHQT